jgi:hypothetical protein
MVMRFTAKKNKLMKRERRTKWAPVWAVLKKYGKGKRVHPSSMTRIKRRWNQTKLKIKPRRMRKNQVG